LLLQRHQDLRCALWRNRGLPQKPTHRAQKPTHRAQKLAHRAQKPTHRAQKPTHRAQKPTHRVQTILRRVQQLIRLVLLQWQRPWPRRGPLVQQLPLQSGKSKPMRPLRMQRLRPQQLSLWPLPPPPTP
jgi:hypothetical protein